MSEKSELWSRLMRVYIRARMRRAFHDVLALGLFEARATVASEPVILALNHVAWWDALLLTVLEGELGAEGFALMDASSLRELSFFRRLGALSLDRAHPKKALSDLDRAAHLLDRAGRFVAIFPRGAQRPSHFPLEFRSGIFHLQKRSQATILPIALRYEFLENARPSLLISLGEPLPFEEGARAEQVVPRVEEAVARELTRIDGALESMLQTPLVAPGGVDSLLYRAPRPLRAGRVPLLARLIGTGKSDSSLPERSRS
ncbi:MAG: hypothetical protein B6A08_02640 [Sorangiineae bacterium NIC37A_2]|jgi:1-acyl-sn-glycerol-3-phosphate acyltransferase|nr:MAG: hypothetical protein B6A08_02640 [Sorangiineae bacterium NIC37A_2]